MPEKRKKEKYYCWQCQKQHFKDCDIGREHVRFKSYEYWRLHRFDRRQFCEVCEKNRKAKYSLDGVIWFCESCLKSALKDSDPKITMKDVLIKNTY